MRIRCIALILTLAAAPFVLAHGGKKHAPAAAKKLKSPVPDNDATKTAGRALYASHCGSCHGLDGKSQTDKAKSMKSKPADLTAHETHMLVPGEVYWIITNGIKGTMPGYKASMTDTERWQLTVYVQSLAN